MNRDYGKKCKPAKGYAEGGDIQDDSAQYRNSKTLAEINAEKSGGGSKSVLDSFDEDSRRESAAKSKPEPTVDAAMDSDSRRNADKDTSAAPAPAAPKKQSFGAAFAAAGGKAFEWNGKKYSGDRADKKPAAPAAKKAAVDTSGAGQGRGFTKAEDYTPVHMPASKAADFQSGEKDRSNVDDKATETQSGRDRAQSKAFDNAPIVKGLQRVGEEAGKVARGLNSKITYDEDSYRAGAKLARDDVAKGGSGKKMFGGMFKADKAADAKTVAKMANGGDPADFQNLDKRSDERSQGATSSTAAGAPAAADPSKPEKYESVTMGSSNSLAGGFASGFAAGSQLKGKKYANGGYVAGSATPTEVGNFTIQRNGVLGGGRKHYGKKGG